MERSEDDDLTSLTWLQDKNLLKGINLRTNTMGKQESPTSDYIEDCPSEQGESTCSSINSSSPVPQQNSKNKHPPHIPYDPKIHVTTKPPYSFSCLIFMSIENSEGKALPVKEIYSWILEHFPYYKNAPTGWKNSVRHNLSLNKCFRKVDKAPNLGKGSLWMVDPEFRPNLVQALMKAPYHPYTNIERVTKNSNLNKIQTSTVSNHIKQEPVGASPGILSSGGVRASGGESNDGYSQDELDDVDAANAMLVLKHGPQVGLDMLHRRDEYNQVLRQSPSIQNGVKMKQESPDSINFIGGGRILSADHTYSADVVGSCPSIKEEDEEPSADEAFADGSDSNSSWSRLVSEGDPEERRKTAEGADALLNLAGIRTESSCAARLLEDPPLPPAKRSCLNHATPPSSKSKLANNNNNNLSSNNNNILPNKFRRKPICPQKVSLKSKR